MALASTGFANTENGFFFEQEAVTEKRSSCERIIEKLQNNESIDELAGDVIYNLKYINIHYLLEDFDEATRPGSKKRYVSKEDLESEIEAKKRDIYCRVELAMYLDKQPQEVTFGLEQFIAAALEKVDDTYQSALSSFQKKDYDRARYAFDLIAPYKDSNLKFSVAANYQARADKGTKALAEKNKSIQITAKKKTAAVSGTKQKMTIGKGSDNLPETLGAINASQARPMPQIDEEIAKDTIAMFTAGPILKAALMGEMEQAGPGPISRAAQRL